MTISVQFAVRKSSTSASTGFASVFSNFFKSWYAVDVRKGVVGILVLFITISSFVGVAVYLAKKTFTSNSTSRSISLPTSDLKTHGIPPLNSSSPKATIHPGKTDPIAIKINGDQDCLEKTQLALELLRDKAPNHYANIIKYIGIVECADDGSGMFAQENPPRYRVGKATISAGTVWYAGTIAHDANHSRLYHDYLSAHPTQLVPFEIWTGESAEAQCLDVQYDALSKIGAGQSDLDYVKNVRNTKYWEISYEDRWW